MVGYHNNLMSSSLRDYDYITSSLVDESCHEYPEDTRFQRRVQQNKMKSNDKNIPLITNLESEPIEVLRAHQDIIDEFNDMYFETLWQKIKNLPVLIASSNIPEYKGNNLFYLIIFNGDITDFNKKELIEVLLFEKGYDKWGIQLFNNPFYHKLLDNKLCYEILENVYKHNLINKNLLKDDVERDFITKCIKNNKTNVLDMCKTQMNHHRKLQLLTDWINTQTSATEIITIYDTLQKRDLNLTPYDLQCFLKIAKQKILEIEIKNRSSFHRDEDGDRISDFLDRHRGGWTSCFACLFTRRSVDIHKMINQGSFAEANLAWKSEDISIHKSFYNRYRLR